MTEFYDFTNHNSRFLPLPLWIPCLYSLFPMILKWYGLDPDPNLDLELWKFNPKSFRIRNTACEEPCRSSHTFPLLCEQNDRQMTTSRLTGTMLIICVDLLDSYSETCAKGVPGLATAEINLKISITVPAKLTAAEVFEKQIPTSQYNRPEKQVFRIRIRGGIRFYFADPDQP